MSTSTITCTRIGADGVECAAPATHAHITPTGARPICDGHAGHAGEYLGTVVELPAGVVRCEYVPTTSTRPCPYVATWRTADAPDITGAVAACYCTAHTAGAGRIALVAVTR